MSSPVTMSPSVGTYHSPTSSLDAADRNGNTHHPDAKAAMLDALQKLIKDDATWKEIQESVFANYDSIVNAACGDSMPSTSPLKGLAPYKQACTELSIAEAKRVLFALINEGLNGTGSGFSQKVDAIANDSWNMSQGASGRVLAYVLEAIGQSLEKAQEGGIIQGTRTLQAFLRGVEARVICANEDRIHQGQAKSECSDYHHHRGPIHDSANEFEAQRTAAHTEHWKRPMDALTNKIQGSAASCFEGAYDFDEETLLTVKNIIREDIYWSILNGASSQHAPKSALRPHA